MSAPEPQSIILPDPHGVFFFNADAYQSQDVIAILREGKKEIRIQLRGIEDYRWSTFNSEKERDEIWERAVADWCAALLSMRQPIQVYAGESELPL